MQPVQNSRGALKILHKFVKYLCVCVRVCMRACVCEAKVCAYVYMCMFLYVCVLKKSISSLRISPLRAGVAAGGAAAAAAAALATGHLYDIFRVIAEQNSCSCSAAGDTASPSPAYVAHLTAAGVNTPNVTPT